MFISQRWRYYQHKGLLSAVTTVLVIKTSVVKYNERTSVNTSYHINNIRETTIAVETKGIVGRKNLMRKKSKG